MEYDSDDGRHRVIFNIKINLPGYFFMRRIKIMRLYHEDITKNNSLSKLTTFLLILEKNNISKLNGKYKERITKSSQYQDSFWPIESM